MGIASIAIVEAADRFDPERGVLFRTFASNWIRGRIQEEIKRILKYSDRESYISDIWKTGSDYISVPDPTETLFDKEEIEYELVDSLAPEDEIEREVYYKCIVGDQGLKVTSKELHMHWTKAREIKNKILQDLRLKLQGENDASN